MSQPIDLELTEPRLTISNLGFLMLLISLLLLGFVLRQSQVHQARDVATLQDLNKKTLPTTAPVQRVEATSPEELKQVATIVESLITPWQPLMLAIERADMPDIALLSIDPNIKKQQVLLVGEAKNLQTVLRYIEQLEAQEVLHDVYLQKHMIEETDISKPVTFSVLTKWKLSE